MTEQDILNDWDRWVKLAKRANAFARARGDFASSRSGSECSYRTRILRNSGGCFTAAEIARRIGVVAPNVGSALRRLVGEGKLSIVGKSDTGARIYAAVDGDVR